MGGEENMAGTHAHLGRERSSVAVLEYESPDDYSDQGDTRVVKFLQYPYQVLAPSPMINGEEILRDKVAVRGQTVYTDELGPYYLSRGEELGAFFTSAELDAMQSGETGNMVLPEERAGIQDADGEGANSDFREFGSHEMAEYLEEHDPTVDETLALVEGDPEAAKRLLEAENIVTNNDPRTGVVKGIEKIVASA